MANRKGFNYTYPSMIQYHLEHEIHANLDLTRRTEHRSAGNKSNGFDWIEER